MPLKAVPTSDAEAKRSFWNRRTEVEPEAGVKKAVAAAEPDASPTPVKASAKNPSPAAIRTAEEIKELARNEESFKSFLGNDDPFTHGFRRTLQYIRARRPEFANEDDFYAVVSKFVEQYPTSVRQVDAEYWAGMKAARDAWKILPKHLGGA